MGKDWWGGEVSGAGSLAEASVLRSVWSHPGTENILVSTEWCKGLRGAGLHEHGQGLVFPCFSEER